MTSLCSSPCSSTATSCLGLSPFSLVCALGHCFSTPTLLPSVGSPASVAAPGRCTSALVTYPALCLQAQLFLPAGLFLSLT